MIQGVCSGLACMCERIKNIWWLLVAFGSSPHTGIPPCIEIMHKINLSHCIDCVEHVLQCASSLISFIFVFAVLVASQGVSAQTRIRWHILNDLYASWPGLVQCGGGNRRGGVRLPRTEKPWGINEADRRLRDGLQANQETGRCDIGRVRPMLNSKSVAGCLGIMPKNTTNPYTLYRAVFRQLCILNWWSIIRKAGVPNVRVYSTRQCCMLGGKGCWLLFWTIAHKIFLRQAIHKPRPINRSSTYIVTEFDVLSELAWRWWWPWWYFTSTRFHIEAMTLSDLLQWIMDNSIGVLMLKVGWYVSLI
jgi:hypothetical protein